VAPAFAQRIERLRQQIAALQDEAADCEEAETSIRVEVTGEGGGSWYLNVGGGRMEVDAAPTYPVLLSLSQNADDWHALARSGTMLGGAGAGGQGTRGVLTRSRIARLREVSGTVRLVLINADDGAERSVTLHLGPGEPASLPLATVSMRDDDARRLREGSLQPHAAFLQGLVTIRGDMSLAVQLGTALFM
jgi:hypothetical protein